MTFTVAIIGRPNVGKSTLFNKLAGKKLALVHDTPGVTRDWKMAEAELMGMEFRIIDTAGLEESFDESIEGKMRRKTEEALAQADLAILMIDARANVLPMDRHFAQWLRKQEIPVLLVANKVENKQAEYGVYEAFSLGFGQPILLSAEHGRGFSELYDAIKPHYDAWKKDHPTEAGALENQEDENFDQYREGGEKGFGDEAREEDFSKPVKLAIVGRPNVGKSTLVNALLGQERMMTGPEPGVTRDAVSIDWDYEGRTFRLVDTAGMRKKARVVDTIEKMAVDDALRAIRLAQVVVLVLDADRIMDKQDVQIADHVIQEGRALVIAVNKWDIVKSRKEALQKLDDRLKKSLAQVQGIPVLTLSAMKKRGLDHLMNSVLEAYEVWNTRVPTGKLNRWLDAMEAAHPPPMTKQKRPNRLRYITQVKARPPTFALWCSRPQDLPDSYQRYLVQGMREAFNMPGTPIRFLLRTSKNPYKD